MKPNFQYRSMREKEDLERQRRLIDPNDVYSDELDRKAPGEWVKFVITGWRRKPPTSND